MGDQEYMEGCVVNGMQISIDVLTMAEGTAVMHIYVNKELFLSIGKGPGNARNCFRLLGVFRLSVSYQVYILYEYL